MIINVLKCIKLSKATTSKPIHSFRPHNKEIIEALFESCPKNCQKNANQLEKCFDAGYDAKKREEAALKVIS